LLEERNLLKTKKVIITGGAGFIGSNLARALCDHNEVVVIDNLITGRLKNVSCMAGRIKFINADVTDLDVLRRVFSSADYVMHQAALPSVIRSVKDPIASNHHNVDGILNVLVAAKECGVKRVVFASSSSVYGNTPVLPKIESFQPNPMSPYAVTKLAGEYYCKVFYEIYGLETVSLRYFNVFGPAQDPLSQYAAVIPKFITALKSGSRPVIYGDGEQSRDFTYVENVVNANILACTAQKAPGRAINIACGERRSLNKLLSILKELLDSNIEPIHADPRPGDVNHSLADISLAKELLGYEPKFDLNEGLKSTVATMQ
jgi:nucleoside-diphosphate-sugar epimerase